MRAPRKLWLLFAMAAVAGLGASVRAWQEAPVMLSGCVERDAAASAPVFKLVVRMEDGRTRLYQLNAPANMDLPAVVGKTAQVTGVPTVEQRSGRTVNVINVKSLKVVAEGCDAMPTSARIAAEGRTS